MGNIMENNNVTTKKRILVLNYEFPPLGGGAGNATFYLLKEFAKYKDLEIDLVTSSVDKFRIEKFSDNIIIHYLDINKKGNLHYQSITDLLKYSLKAYYYSKKLKKKVKFDLVHAFFGIPCGFIAMKLDIPYIVSLRGADVPFHKKRFYWLDKLIFKKLSKKIWKNAKSVIANSQGLAEAAKVSSPKQEIDVIYNGIDTEQFFSLPERRKTDELIKLISVGRLAHEKGYSYLLKALTGLSNIELTLIGSGPGERKLRELAVHLKVNINFTGRLDKREIIKKLQNSDIFILPSLKEGMSNAVLEAMACSLPIITTDTGGSKELIRNNGYIVEKKSALALEEVIKKYLESPSLAVNHGINSRKIAEEMSWERVASGYNYYYNA
jgi:L-malate glycosyltransferase